MSNVGRFSKGRDVRKAHAASMLVVKRTKPDFPSPKNNTDIYMYINIRPSNVKALSIPIAPMTIWPPPCCFEGELAEIESYTQARLEFGIPFHAAAKNPPGCLKPARLKPCMTYDDPVVLPIHAPRRCEPLITP